MLKNAEENTPNNSTAFIKKYLNYLIYAQAIIEKYYQEKSIFTDEVAEIKIYGILPKRIEFIDKKITQGLAKKSNFLQITFIKNLDKLQENGIKDFPNTDITKYQLSAIKNAWIFAIDSCQKEQNDLANNALGIKLVKDAKLNAA